MVPWAGIFRCLAVAVGNREGFCPSHSPKRGGEFKKLAGITPYQYLLNKKLDQAKILLASPDNTIGSVSLDLGFNDQSHFTRAFKNRFDVTPGKFQKQSKS